jgi:hypothetical protein
MQSLDSWTERYFSWVLLGVILTGVGYLVLTMLGVV